MTKLDIFRWLASMKTPVTVRQVAEKAGVKLSTADNWLRAGEAAGLILGERWEAGAFEGKCGARGRPPIGWRATSRMAPALKAGQVRDSRRPGRSGAAPKATKPKDLAKAAPKGRKHLTPEQRARKQERDRARRAAQKAAS